MPQAHFSADALLRALACTQVHCRCHGSEAKGYGLTHCPAHDDQRPALSVSARNGTVLWSCKAGCDQGVVTAAIHALFPLPERSSPNVNGRVVTRRVPYDWTTKDGAKVTHTRIEYDERRENGKPVKEVVWPPGTKMESLRLYGIDRLPPLKANDPLFVVEGEPVVEALLGIGIAAVTLPSSTLRDRSALDELGAERFAKIRVVVAPDNDTTGDKNARASYEHLKRIHQRVWWLPPVSEGPGDDFVDLLAPLHKDMMKSREAVFLALNKTALDGPPQQTVAQVPSDTTIKVVRIWEHDEPAPRSWLLPGLLPTGATSILYGDSAMKKSYLCLHLTVCLAADLDFLGMRIGKATGRTLWVDVELDEDEHKRRSYAVARSYGLDRPQEGMYYVRPRRGLLHKDTMEEITDLVADLQPDLTILDSFTKALSGGDVFIPNQVTATMESIEGWGSSLLIDHIKNVPMGTSQGDLGPFGTAFKRHLARSLIQVVSASGGGMSLVHKKSNFGPEHSPVYYAVAFDPYQDNPNRLHTVGLKLLRADDPEMQGIEDNLPTNTLTNRVLLNTPIWPDTASPRQIGDAVQATADTVSAILSKLEKKGLVTNPDRGKWTRPRLVPLQEEEPDA